MPDTPYRFPWSAWAVHALTATGAVWALLALLAVIEGNARLAFLWLGVALIVDGIDGPMARLTGVTSRTPRFDGAALDLIVDYLTYVFVPVILIWKFGMLPQGLEIAGCIFILTTSLHLFAKLDMKSSDNHFVGFPGVWNLVALYFFVLGTDPWLNAGVTLLLGLLTFAPAKFVHPFRVVRLRAVTLPISALWGVAAVVLVWAHPAQPAWALAALAMASIWVVGISLWRSMRP